MWLFSKGQNNDSFISRIISKQHLCHSVPYILHLSIESRLSRCIKWWKRHTLFCSKQGQQRFDLLSFYLKALYIYRTVSLILHYTVCQIEAYSIFIMCYCGQLVLHTHTNEATLVSFTCHTLNKSQMVETTLNLLWRFMKNLSGKRELSIIIEPVN